MKDNPFIKDSIKYTSDGKKVVVVGSLNSKQIIVQEVFVTKKGDEIPSGENFIVESLHDEPVESWKERELKNLEREYSYLSENYKKQIRELEKKIEYEKRATRTIISNLKAFQDNADNDHFNTLLDFMCGDIKYLLFSQKWRSYDIIEFKDAMSYDGYSRSSMRLLSLYGKTDGNLEYALHQYPEGSSTETIIIPFKSYDSALSELINIITNKDKLEDRDFEASKKFNIKLDGDKLKSYYQSKINSELRIFDNYKKKMEKANAKINELKDLQNNVK